MSRESPQAAFEHARDALRRLDWPDFFACLDVGDLKRIAENAVALGLGSRIDDAEAEVRAICGEHGFPLDDVLRARRRIMESAGPEATRNHRDTMKRGLAAVKNLPGFLAALEGYSRRTAGGGSVSTRLFQDERLTDVRIDGARARGRRVFGQDSGDDVEFVLRKGQWHVKLITRSLTR